MGGGFHDTFKLDDDSAEHVTLMGWDSGTESKQKNNSYSHNTQWVM